MPKTGLPDLEKRRRTVLACIASKKVLNGWDDKSMAMKARLSPTTFKRRIGKPENFTLNELWGMGLTVYIYDGQSKLPTEDGLIELRG